MSKVRDPLAWARFWIAEHGSAFGVPIGGLVAVAVIALIFYPFAPPVSVAGTVVAFGVFEDSDTGTYPAAVVRLADGGQTTVTLPRANACRVGGPIRLLRRRSLFGALYGPALPPCGWPH